MGRFLENLLESGRCGSEIHSGVTSGIALSTTVHEGTGLHMGTEIVESNRESWQRAKHN